MRTILVSLLASLLAATAQANVTPRFEIYSSALPDGAATEATLSSFKDANHQDLLDVEALISAFAAANHTDLLGVQSRQDTQTANQTNGTQRTQVTNGTDNAAVESGASDGTIASVFGLVTKARNMVFNGSTWDRVRSLGIGTNVPSTGIQAAGIYGQYYDPENIPDLSNGNFGIMQMTKRGTPYATIFGPDMKRTAFISQFNALKTTEVTQIIGDNFSGTSLNTMIWTTTVANAGSVIVGGALAELRTNTTANGSAAIQSTGVARFMAGAPNSYFAGVRLGDTGVANNERRWGAWTTTDGVYYKLSGTTLSACALNTSVETCVASGSFNGGNAFTLDTNFHVYEIHYSSGTAMFLQDRKLMHTMVSSTAAVAGTMHLPMRYSNTNSGGSTTAASLYIRGTAIQRYGRPQGRPKYSYYNTATTSNIKVGPGTVHRIIITRNGAIGGNSVTLYDNTTATGTIIGSFFLGGSDVIPIEINTDFYVGLSIDPGSANYQTTVVWE